MRRILLAITLAFFCAPAGAQDGLLPDVKQQVESSGYDWKDFVESLSAEITAALLGDSSDLVTGVEEQYPLLDSVVLESNADSNVGAVANAASIPTRYLDVSGRFYCYSDERWTGFSNNYGHATFNYNQNGGTGTEPSVQWAQWGPILHQGEKVKRLVWFGRGNNNQISTVRVRVWHQTGPWEGNWDSTAETTRTLLYSNEALSFPTADWKRHDILIDSPPMAEDGFLIIHIKPNGNMTSTRYLYSSIRLTVEES